MAGIPYPFYRVDMPGLGPVVLTPCRDRIYVASDGLTGPLAVNGSLYRYPPSMTAAAQPAWDYGDPTGPAHLHRNACHCEVRDDENSGSHGDAVRTYLTDTLRGAVNAWAEVNSEALALGEAIGLQWDEWHARDAEAQALAEWHRAIAARAVAVKARTLDDAELERRVADHYRTHTRA